MENCETIILKSGRGRLPEDPMIKPCLGKAWCLGWLVVYRKWLLRRFVVANGASTEIKMDC